MNHEDYMRIALEEAVRGMGWTNPNPMVGAVIVKDGRIIGKGYHHRCGELHAERNAIADCREDVANKRGRIVCPACGASVPKDAAFCMRCGAAMPEKEEEPEDAEFVHVEPEEKAEETEAAAPEEEPEEEPEKEAEVPEEE